MVTVQAESPLLQTASNELGQVVDRQFLDRLDAVTRRPLNPYLDPAAFQRLADFQVTPEPERYGWLRGPSWLWAAILTPTKIRQSE